MKKLLLPLFLTVVTGVPLHAEMSEVEFTYTDPSARLSALGNRLAESFDVAMLLDNPGFRGMKIMNIRAFINTTDVTNTSLWLSNRLTVKDGVSQPDIFSSGEISPASSELYGENVAVLEYDFEQPYELTGDPLYVGYSMAVEKAYDEATKYPVIISKVQKPNSLYLRTSSQIPQWSDYSSMGAAAIILTLEKESREYSLAITGIGEGYCAEGESFGLTLNVCNTGDNPVTGFKYSYSYDGEGDIPLLGEYLFDTPLNPDLYSSMPVELTLEGPHGFGSHEAQLFITEVNGLENNPAASSQPFNVYVLHFIPEHRPLIEEYTGLWCGYCPRGFIAMEYIAEEFDDKQVSICYHNDDPMAVTSQYPVAVGAFPNATVDRQRLIDPYYGTSGTGLGIFEDVESAMKKITYASIDVSADLDGDDINIRSEVTFNRDFETSPYLIGYVLTCNGLTDPGWYQVNNFANNSSLKGTPLEPLVSWGRLVKDLVFNDVAVNVSGMKGVSGSLPSAVAAMTPYVHEYSYNIAGNDLIQNLNNVVINAFIVDMITGEVINANKFRLRDSAGVDTIAGSQPVSTIYYDMAGRRIENPGKGIYIRVQTMEDGTVKTSKIIY